MGIRTILYGYEIRDGQKSVCPEEAMVVREVFTLYLGGASYQNIAETLEKRGVPYGETGTSWNKPRIKRILEDQRYLGRKDYPAVIDPRTFQSVQDAIQNKSGKRTQAKPSPADQTFAQLSKYLRCAGCGTLLIGQGGRNQNPGTAYLRCRHCKIMLPVVKTVLTTEVEKQISQREEPRQSEYQPSAEVVRLTNLIDRSLETADHPEETMNLILQAVSARYDCCPDPEPVKHKSLTEMTARQLDSLITRVTISTDSTITVHFRAIH